GAVDGAAVTTLNGIAPLARGRGAEDKRGGVIVIGIDHHEEHVVEHFERIAAGQAAGDPGLLAVEEPRPDVERVVVVEDADLGILGGRFSVAGHVATEPGRYGRSG